MSNQKTLREVAEWVRDNQKSIIVIYAFNATGKTRLSVEYKELMRDPKTHRQTGIYYNAFSEDLFAWDNDILNSEKEVKLRVVNSSLNARHRDIDEEKVRALLTPYHVNYDFRFDWVNGDPEQGIEYINFFKSDDPEKNIKVSRGEERLFVWNFFLAMFLESGDHLIEQKYFFIDDPVASLDDNNLFVTASRLVELMKENLKTKIIVTTHHMGFFSTLVSLMRYGDGGALTTSKMMTEGGNVTVVDDKYDIRFMERRGEQYKLKGRSSGYLQYHLLMLSRLKEMEEDDILPLHFAQLRQILELISSFQGKGSFNQALITAGVEEIEGVKVAERINALTHQRVYERAIPLVSPQDKVMLKMVVGALEKAFKFSI